MTLLHVLAAVSHAVAATGSRSAKRDAIAACLRQAQPHEIEPLVAFLSGEVRQSRLGVGHAALSRALGTGAADGPSLEVADVDAAFERLAETAGKGSATQREAQLRSLFARATHDEQRFLVRLLAGDLRQGALEGVMAEAVAAASGTSVADVRRAAMLAGGLPAVARVALSEGRAGLMRYQVALHRPVQPMLAQPAQDVADALARLGTAALEWKIDGARVQVHKSSDRVRVYTRNLNDVSDAVPEIVQAVQALPARELILDGETIALRLDGTPQPFQVTMRRFGRKQGVAALRSELPLSTYFFDCLRRDGEAHIDCPAHERFAALAQTLPAPLLVPRLVTSDLAAAEDFYGDALARGHEGVMAKALDAPYEAGGRGAAWLKVKHARTLDLLVLAAEWGHGRRQGWLSNLHLGARDPGGGGPVMLGKTFKGLTDEMLQWQTRELLARELERDGHTVYVRPELVVEIAFNDVQASTQYPGGLALRFARVKGYRPDKRAEDADTIDAVRAIHAGIQDRGGR